MPEWNLGQIMSKATARIGRRADIPQSEASFWANQAYDFVRERADHALVEAKAIASTSSGSDVISLPRDYDEMISLSYVSDVGSRRTLRQISPSNYDAVHDPEGGELGVPEWYMEYRDCLELHPSPDSAYSLQMRYKSFKSELKATSDVPSLHSSWRWPVVLKTEEYLADYLNDFELARAKRNDFLQALRSLNDSHGKRQKEDSGMGVRVYTGEVKR